MLLSWSHVRPRALPADDLKLVELKPEHSARVLDQGSDAEGTVRGPGVLRCHQIPNL